MIFSTKTRSNLFVMFVVLFFLAAIYHFVGIFYKVNDAPVWKHLLFVEIDLFCAYGILRRPKYFAYLFALFLLQQYYSHGTYLINMWNEKKQVHLISLFVLFVLPFALICLIEGNKTKSKEEE